MMLQGVLAVSDLPLVSMDFKKSDVSTTIDSSLTMVMGDDMVKVCLLQRFKHIVMHRLPYNRLQYNTISYPSSLVASW